MSECNIKEREDSCACTYSSCSRRGKCIECIQYHLNMDQLPGCVFAKISKEAEVTYNRDFKYFAQLILGK
jgi:hypothetical protein